MRTLDTFERMWSAYKPIRDASYDLSLGLEDLVAILSERMHPSNR